jgi:hypothetical protein
MGNKEEDERNIKLIIDTYADVVLINRKYTRDSETWDHDHCDVCGQKFIEKPGPDAIDHGFSTVDAYNWICEACVGKYSSMATWILRTTDE